MTISGLRPLTFQSGLLVGIAGQPLLLEVLDRTVMSAAVWESVFAAAAVEAADPEAFLNPGRRARRFVDRVAAPPVPGDGSAVARSVYTDLARRSTLTWHGRLVHNVATNPRHELLAG